MNITEKLDAANAKYTMHRVPDGVGKSVAEHIAAFDLSFADGCSTLVFMADGKPVALMRRDDCRVDSKLLKKEIGCKSLRIATVEELKEFTGFAAGEVSPITLELPCFMDKLVLERDSIRVGTGGNEYSLEIDTKDLQEITKAKVISVCSLKELNTAQRVLSGITPSSSRGLHLGNYLGAVKNHIEFQTKAECFYFIADYHALNTVFDPKAFNRNVMETFIDYLALGIDTEKTTFFVESRVPTIFELAEILSNTVTYAQMQRMHAFKDKLADANADIGSINMGLFNYPILMAADILMFDTDVVPVGEDQSQHVEVARDIAKSFNARYGHVLKVPELFVKKEVARVLGTDGVRKMSKSLGNDLSIFATESDLRNQIMGITTDPGRIHPTDAGDPTKNVIFSYMRLMDFDAAKLADYEERYKAGTVGDVEIKQDFYNFFMDYFAVARKNRVELAKDHERIKEIMRTGAEKAKLVSDKVIDRTRRAIGALA